MIKLLAVSDGAGQMWNPAGGPIAEQYRGWSPQQEDDVEYFDFEQRKNIPGQQPSFLFEVSSQDPAATGNDIDVNYTPSLRNRNVSISRGDFDGSYPSVPKGHRLDNVGIVVPADQAELSIELLISAGPWDRVADADARKKSRSTTGFSDGGRHGVALMTSVGYDDDRGLTAVASLALRDTESIEEQYRLVALDADGNVLASTQRVSKSGYLAQLVLACPPEMPMPKEFQLQQRPKIPVAFRDISIAPPQ